MEAPQWLNQLVEEQNTLRHRETNLLAGFKRFREGLMTVLQNAIGLATEQGLKGLKPFEHVPGDPQHDTFAMRGVNLTWTSNDDVRFLSDKMPILAAKILLYATDRSTEHPAIEIVYRESSEKGDGYLCNGTIFGAEPQQDLFQHSIRIPSDQFEQKIIEALFTKIYHLKRVWEDAAPSLKHITAKNASKVSPKPTHGT